jgi:hypothetical protein
VLGTLSAQQIHTTYTTSSVLYQSGSTKFGDTIDDTHQFTGSLNVSGSIIGSISATNGIVSSSTQIFTGYDYEIHVSQVDGNDTTGNGDLLTPVASITKALTLVAGQRRIIVVHSGGYTENPSITTQYTTITTYDSKADNTILYGTLSTNTGCTISGLKMTDLTITTPTTSGSVNILNCDISGTLTKNSSCDYTLIRFTDIGTGSISGAGLVDITGGNSNFVTVNNASAQVLIKNGTATSPVLTAGNLNLVQAVVIASPTNAVTSAPGSIITIANSQLVNSALTGVAPVVLNGFYSILNTIYDRPSSTLVGPSGTGGSANSIDYFQYINADKFITQGGTSNQFVKGDGSLQSIIAATTGSNVFVGDQTITGSLAINDVATNFLIEGNGFSQTYLTSNGAIVLNPGYGGVEMVGSYKTFKADDITADGTLLVKGSTTLGDNGADNTTISGSLLASGSSHTIQNGYVILQQVSQSLNFVDDTAAAAGGVPLGGLYRNGNFIVIRIV